MSNPTELPDLDRLEALARAATPGPWSWWTSNSTLRLTGADGRDGGVLYGYARQGDGDVNCAPNDQAFIAAANPAALLALIALARRAQPEGEAPQADAMVVPRELLARCLTSMRHAVTFGNTGQGRPPSQTCMFEIEELAALLSAPAAQHAESGAQALMLDALKSCKSSSWKDVDGDWVESQQYDKEKVRAALAAQSQGAQAAKIDVKHEFERWASQRGESSVYIGDGLYRSRSVTEMAEAFAAGVEVARASLAAKAEAPALTPLDYRAQGREEALAIILAESAEDPFSECTGWSKSGAPDDEGGAYWKEDELRALLHIGDRTHDAYDRAEAMYWEALGRKDEAARELLFAQQAPFYKPLHDFLSKHEAWDLMADLKRAQQAAAPGALALLNADELAALRRFDETCQDGEGYDVPKAMMQRLAAIGVVRRTSGSYYETTDFGMRVLDQPAPYAPGTPEAPAGFRLVPIKLPDAIVDQIASASYDLDDTAREIVREDWACTLGFLRAAQLDGGQGEGA